MEDSDSDASYGSEWISDECENYSSGYTDEDSISDSNNNPNEEIDEESSDGSFAQSLETYPNSNRSIEFSNKGLSEDVSCIEFSFSPENDMLLTSIKSKDLASVLKHIENGADVNYSSYHHGSPVFYAVRHNNDEIVTALLKAGADPNLLHNYRSALFLAVTRHKSKTIKTLLDYGADVHFRYPWGSRKRSILHEAVLSSDVSVIELLLDHGADVNAKDNNGASVLYWAAKHRSPTRYPAFDDSHCVNALKLLISRGAEVVKDGPRGEDSAFQAVLDCGTLNSLKLFLANGAKLENYRNRPLLHMMYRNPQEDVIEFVLNTNLFDIEMKSSIGRTVLHKVVKDNINRSRLDVWLRFGANPNSFDESGRTPLLVALLSCWSNNVEYLLENGARLDIDIFRQAGSVRSEYHKDICCKHFVAHVALLEGQDCEFDSDALDLIDDYELQHFYRICKEEVALLKNSVIHDGFTYYDFLVSENIYRIADNEVVQNIFEASEIIASKFPIYGKRVCRRFPRLQEKLGALKGLDRLIELDSDVFHHIYHKILHHLRRVDLENLNKVE